MSSLSRRPRLGAISFLNARPLVAPLLDGSVSHRFDISSDVPSLCADRIHQGAIDVALAPSMEYASHGDDYEIVPDVCISSDGPVASVVLFSRVPPAEITRLAVDTNSRSSAALVRVLLWELHSADPAPVAAEPSVDGMLRVAQAGLLIGDAAIDQEWPPGVSVFDLGNLWKTLTGLPFVYAVWTCRKGSLEANDARALIQAKKKGIGLFNELADDHARTHPKPAVLYESYLRENVRYDLGQREINGLLEFFRLAHSLGIVQQAPELRFVEC